MSTSSVADLVKAFAKTEFRWQNCDKHGRYKSYHIERGDFWTTCPQCSHEEVLSRERQRLEVREHAQDQAPSRLREATLQPPPGACPQHVAVLQRLRRYVEVRSEVMRRGTWALLAGGVGTGKTWALVALQRELQAHGVAVLLLRASDLIDRAMQQRAQGSSWLMEPDFVLIDECSPGACEHPAFFAALDERYAHARPVVFAGNAAVARDSDAAVARQVLGDRLADRLLHDGAVLRFGWASLRAQQQRAPF